MNQKLPQHVAIVMDGNGRWAEQRGLLRVEGHRRGVDSVRSTVNVCLAKKIPCLSIFAFSSENWARPQEEVNFLMELFIETIDVEMTRLHERGVRVRFIGDRSRLADLLQMCMQSIEQLTEHNSVLTFNIVLNYGGRWDIVQAARSLARDVASGDCSPESIDEALFASRLTTHGLSDPDLMIRTSGELRISNFYLWQMAYSEFYFTDVFWPDFSEDEFNKALDCYALRMRRYGKTSQQQVELAHA